MDEEDLDNYSTSKERVEYLGFTPEKELVYNTLLPYADKLDDESTKIFAEIKTNLAKAVLIKEIKPGCGIWTSRLMKYIKLYGLKFSKKDHIDLIYLVYELVTLPDLEPTKLHKFSTLLILLIKKKHLLSPADLTLPWRPLYDIAQRIFAKSSPLYHYFSPKKDRDEAQTASPVHRLLKSLGIELPDVLKENTIHDESLESTFDMLIFCTKPYFPITATREIMDEILPRFNPWSSTSQDCIQQFMLYIPWSFTQETYSQSVGLWYDDMHLVWSVCHNSLLWESDMMVLMANIAQNNVGYIDWEPHIPLMFTKFLRSFNLPVSYNKHTQNIKQQSIDINGMASWIVSVLGPNSSAQSYLNNLMTTVVTYLHNANTGKWSIRLRELMRRLPTLFVQRLHRERSKYKVTWENKTAPHFRLTENCIDSFVICNSNVAVQAMFSRTGVNDACLALQQLALLRPSIVVPPVISKLLGTLDSLTEPHKLTCALQCVVAVVRPICSGFTNGYPEGPTHVIPLLFASLPGLDPNDFKKTLVTLHFISIFSTFVPLVDCSNASEYWKDLTEEELIVCEATAQIEDFVLQFFDRVFSLVESSIMEHTRTDQKEPESQRSKLELTSEGALSSTVTSILMQCSPSIFKMALKKFYYYITQRILEINVAGLTAASLCRAFARINAYETFKLFIPYLCDSIMNLLGENDEMLKEETLDNELLFNLLLLSHVVEREGQELLPHMPRIIEVLNRTLNLTCKDGYMFACTTLENIICAMCGVYPKEFRSCTTNYDASIKDFLAIREWGKPGNLWDLKLQWHTPSIKEVDCVQNLIHLYLPKTLQKIDGHINKTNCLAREDLHRSLNTIKALLASVPLLPQTDDPTINLVESKLPNIIFKIETGINGEVVMPDGSNVRKAIATTMQALQKQLLDSNEDDTKNLISLISIWDGVVSRSNISIGNFEGHLKSFSAVKRCLENKVKGRPGHPRALFVDRAQLQHEFRTQSNGVPPSELHAMVMKELVTLATSRYSAVRIRAQGRLNWMMSFFTYSYNIILPQLVEALKADPELEHERLKGALYCLLGPKQTPLIAKHDWTVASTLWPALIHSKPSEKPTAIRLLDCTVNSITLHFPTITIIPKWHDRIAPKARVLLSEEEANDPELLHLIEESDGCMQKCATENVKLYNELLEDIVKGGESTELHWRHSMMCITLLPILGHLDVDYSARAVKLILQCLIHDSIHIRKLGIKLMMSVLKQKKKIHKKIKVDPYAIAKVNPEDLKRVPGFRPDNYWLQYDSEKVFTKDDWDKNPYIHGSCFGYISWPKPLMMYAPPEEQPGFDPPEKLNEGDRAIYDFFSNEANIEKLLGFLTIEEKKGKDKFSGYRFSIFKRLFRIFGDGFLDQFASRLEKLVCNKNESMQRCGAEIIAGMIKGTKHWPYDKAQKVQAALTPILKIALQNMFLETVGDWGTCFATVCDRMDMTRLNWAVHILEESNTSVAGGSSAECGRLYALQAAVAQHPWRAARHACRVFGNLKDQKMLCHPYQLVRDRVASLMTSLFEMDMKFPGGYPSLGPSILETLNEIAPKFDILLVEGMKGISNSSNLRIHNGVDLQFLTAASNDVGSSDNQKMKSKVQEMCEKGNINIEKVNKVMMEFRKCTLKQKENGRNSPLESFAYPLADSKSSSGSSVGMLDNDTALAVNDGTEGMSAEDGAIFLSDTEYDISLRYFKTVLKWVTNAVTRCPFGARPAYYLLLPAACCLGSKEGDEELCRIITSFLTALAGSLHTQEALVVAFETVRKISQSPSWCARASVLYFLQSLVFHNMPLVAGVPGGDEMVRSTVVQLLGDSRLEVREAAAQMLAGLLHCGASETNLLKLFKKKCKGELKKGPGASEALVQRHCGVLGLCAFVAAHPYSVPSYLPEVFQLLGRHLNDPMPIPATIRKTLGDFKRTHHDDWQNHQLKFTEEDLTLLSDLTVPPSYYA